MAQSNRTIRYNEIESPIGPLVLCEAEGALVHIDFGRMADREPALRAWADKVGLSGAAWTADGGSALLRETQRQLAAYFRGERRTFDVPLGMHGTAFQRAVWQALTTVPYGEVRSYKAIAEAVGNPKAVRAVGGANNKNPLPIVVPCHRIIGAGGTLVGYGGGLPIKTFLLDLERGAGGVAGAYTDMLS